MGFGRKIDKLHKTNNAEVLKRKYIAGVLSGIVLGGKGGSGPHQIIWRQRIITRLMPLNSLDLDHSLLPNKILELCSWVSSQLSLLLNFKYIVVFFLVDTESVLAFVQEIYLSFK